MVRLSWVSLCGALVLCGCSGAPAPAAKNAPAEQPQAKGKRLNGSRVSIWLPEGMYRPTRLMALRLDDPALIVVLTEATVAGPEGAQGFLAGMQESGRLVSSAEVERGEAKGFLGEAPSNIEGMTRKLMGLTAGTATVGVVVQYAPEGQALAERILSSIQLDPGAKLDPLALSGVKVGELAGFEVQSGISQPITFFEAGSKPPLAPEAAALALMMLPYPKAEVSDEDLGQMLGATLGNLNPKMDKAKSVELQVDGKPTFAFVTSGERDGATIAVFAFITRYEDSALAGFAHVGEAKADAVLPRVQKLVKSIQLDPAIVGPL
jgi:hypothetical protein